MHRKVHEMIADNIKPSEFIVQGKGHIPDKPPRIEFIPLPTQDKVMKILDQMVL